MPVARMLHFDLYGLRGDLDAVVRLLQRAAAVEIIERQDGAEELRGLAAAKARLEREAGDLERLLAFFARVQPRRPNLIQQFAGIKTVLTEEEFRSYAKDEGLGPALLARAQEIEAEQGSLSSALREREAVLAQLQPWSSLDLTGEDLQNGTKSVRVILGLVEAEEIQLFAAGLRGSEPRAVVRTVFAGREGAGVAVFWPREADFAAAVQGLTFNPVVLPAFDGTIGEGLASAAAAARGIGERLAALAAEAAILAKSRVRIEARLDYVRSEIARLSGAMNLTATRHTFALSGWVPADRVDGLRAELQSSGFVHTLATRPPEEGEDVPVELRNRGPIVPFEALVQGFSYPKYGEIDPTPVTAPFFFLFFGFCLSDAGYGLVLLLFCLALLKWLKMGPAGKKLARLFILGGIGAMIMGFVTGGFFGDLFHLPALIDPIKNALVLLALALALGFIQLFLGIFISALPSVQEGRWRDALFNQGFWLLFLVSTVLLMGKGPFGLARFGRAVDYLALASALGVIYNATRDKKGALGKLLGIPAGLFTIYGSIGFYSDVLSYSRLMALGLSGGVMAMIINLFARMAANSGPIGIALGILIGVFGHSLNIALGILGAYVHSSRLQFLEFYGKFFEGGGRPFRPLRTEYKHTFVVKQKEA